jgi:hypothetical protein
MPTVTRVLKKYDSRRVRTTWARLTNTNEGSTMKQILGLAVLALGSVAVWAQPPPPVFAVPISGGDLIPPQIKAFAPGDPTIGFDGRDAEPSVIANIKGMIAMGYTMGMATDGAGNAYQVVTDLRVFQGDYIGATSTPAGTASERAHGTFVLI